MRVEKWAGHPVTDEKARLLETMQRGIDRSLRKIECLRLPTRRARYEHRPDHGGSHQTLAFRGTGKRRKLTCVDSASFVRSKR